MPRSRSRPKQKKTRVKVRAKPVTKKARIASDAAAFFDRSSLTYDTSESQFANYARLGLLADANQIGAKRDTILGFKPRVKGLPRRGAAAGPSGVATTGAAARPATRRPVTTPLRPAKRLLVEIFALTLYERPLIEPKPAAHPSASSGNPHTAEPGVAAAAARSRNACILGWSFFFRRSDGVKLGADLCGPQQ